VKANNNAKLHRKKLSENFQQSSMNDHNEGSKKFFQRQKTHKSIAKHNFNVFPRALSLADQSFAKLFFLFSFSAFKRYDNGLQNSTPNIGFSKVSICAYFAF
jgi:hypothetical protein